MHFEKLDASNQNLAFRIAQNLIETFEFYIKEGIAFKRAIELVLEQSATGPAALEIFELHCEARKTQ